MASQNIAELQQLKKFVKKVDAAKMRQARMITAILRFLGDLRTLSLT
jgi:hypothetical protein